jgi:hypothetical protein
MRVYLGKLNGDVDPTPSETKDKNEKLTFFSIPPKEANDEYAWHEYRVHERESIIGTSILQEKMVVD